MMLRRGIIAPFLSLKVVSLEKLVTHELDLEAVVGRFYASLYRFALSLTKNEAEAGDLTQQTFFILAQRSHQIRDTSKVKCWLFTTLRREFLRALANSIEPSARRIPAGNP